MKVMSSMKSVKFTYAQIHMHTWAHTNIRGGGTGPQSASQASMLDIQGLV